mgnify:CR=1 FL=1
MKDSQLMSPGVAGKAKYIKANNERFSTYLTDLHGWALSISRRIMKDSQPVFKGVNHLAKYIKANNERFSTERVVYAADV